jgi:hypothetical protein
MICIRTVRLRFSRHETSCAVVRERVLDLLARDACRYHGAHVIRIYRMFAGQLAQHTQRSPKWFLDRRGFEIGKYCRNLGLPCQSWPQLGPRVLSRTAG